MMELTVINATNNNRKTCLVIEKSIPYFVAIEELWKSKKGY